MAAQFRLCRFGFWGKTEGIKAEGAEEVRPSASFRLGKGHGEEWGRNGPPLWRTGPAVAVEIRREEEISTGRWGICNFGLRIAGMKRRVGLCLVALLPA